MALVLLVMLTLLVLMVLLVPVLVPRLPSWLFRLVPALQHALRLQREQAGREQDASRDVEEEALQQRVASEG